MPWKIGGAKETVHILNEMQSVSTKTTHATPMQLAITKEDYTDFIGLLNEMGGKAPVDCCSTSETHDSPLQENENTLLYKCLRDDNVLEIPENHKVYM